MELDQVVKRLQWLEDERRKERDAVALLESRFGGIESSVQALSNQIKELGSDINRLAGVVTRMDQYDGNLAQQRIEARQQVDALEKEIKKREEEAVKVRRLEITNIDIALVDIRKELEPISRLEKTLGLRMEEEARLRRMIDETREKIDSLRRDEEEYTRTYRLLEDARRQDSKRILDLQGEMAAIRKRSDEQRGQTEVINNSLRKIEGRINELVAVEAERRDSMTNFIDRQTLAQVERDRQWKDWQIRFDTIENQATDVESRLLSMDATQREAKRIQVVIEELAARVDRRVNEITEIQRLSEDRFRQEWITFKADDQKRWTNYTLNQEEQRGESTRQYGKLEARAIELEDTLQQLQDVLLQANEETSKRLQAYLAVAHEAATSFERTVGRGR